MLLHVTDITSGPGIEFVPEDALYRGKWVHRVCHLLDLGRLDVEATEASAPQWWGFVEAWINAKQTLGIEVLASEEHTEDLRRGYCGTRDKRIVTAGRRGQGVIDLKLCGAGTGQIPDSTGMQTAAYVGEAKLWRGAVALHPDGTFRWYDDRRDPGVFLATDWREFCARLFAYQMDIKRGWREAPPPRED